MISKASIIIPYLNEPNNEVYKTINSIYETASRKRFEIIVINDNSEKRFTTDLSCFKEVKVVNNKNRIGVDACRQLGADMAIYDHLCFFDAHMRFSKGWMSRVIENIKKEPSTLWCTTCMGLGYGNMDLSRSRDKYYGADFVLKNGSNEILEPKWANGRQKGIYEIPCVLGANYGVSKDWFQHIHGLKGLKMWGGSELFMSLKTWMAGGACKINSDVRIGHKFRDRAPYSTGAWNMTYNKIYMCKTLLPKELSDLLIGSLAQTLSTKRAMKEIEKNEEYIKTEKEYYDGIFKRDVISICDQWNVSIPS